jgi:pyruvate formate-lyase/glycerol dehydratase family glycyl radical enzyme
MTAASGALPVPPRVLRLREELFATETRLCFERARIVTRSYLATEGEPWAIRRARALAAVFEQMPLLVRPGELLVGQRAAILAGRSVYPEYNLDGLTAETTPAEVWDAWQGRTLKDEVYGAFPEDLARAERELACAYATGSGSGFGHVIVDYEKALRVGFRAIIREARQRLAEAPAGDVEGRSFLEAVAIAAAGIIRWAERYAEHLERDALTESDAGRRAELEAMARVCRHVPAEPATTLHEALQSFWFTHLAMHVEQYGWSISAGRFDQYIAPFYAADLAAGRISAAQGWELLLSLWVKFMENVGTRLKTTIFQNLTLGGQDAAGRDQSNEVSHLCLDASVALRFNQPALSVRWHPGIDPAFWDHVHGTIAQGLGLPALFNDNVILEALTSHGVSREDAVGYGIVGCVEACVPGRQQGVTAGGHLNVAKALELALNQGISLVSGERIGVSTPAPETFDGYDDLWRALEEQVLYLSSLNIQATQIAGAVQRRRGHCPLMSALLDDCVARRRDLVAGGTRYSLPGVSVFGNSNVYDGLAAIRKFVCEERRVSWAELRRALQADFQGHEPLRRMLANGAPRWGNDRDDVDGLANEVNALYAGFCWAHADPRGGRYTCGVWPVEGHVHSGRWTGAGPDGRRAGTTLADGVGACHGADRGGPTALLRSVAKLNNVDHWAAGNTCNIKFSRSLIAAPSGVGLLRDLVTTYMRLGGQQLQINVVDAETLRDARVHPERYQDLIVRVAGFSAYFTLLSADVQDEIIMRTEQAAVGL